VTKPFSPDFYTATATIIPVLFVAIAARGPTYQNALHQLWGRFKWALRTIPPQKDLPAEYPELDNVVGNIAFVVGWTAWGVVITLIFALTLTLGIAIVIAGGYGELVAIYALYQGQAQATTAQIVLLATMFLVVLVVTAPAIASLINASGPAPDDQQGQEAQPPGPDAR
jgi:hypothetical protein